MAPTSSPTREPRFNMWLGSLRILARLEPPWTVRVRDQELRRGSDPPRESTSLGIKDDPEVERVSIYHLGLLLIRTGKFDRASDLLLKAFGGSQISEQLKIALGLATLRIGLLPEEIEPSKEALVLAAGSAASAGTEALDRFPALLQTYPDVPYVHYAYGLALATAGSDKEAIRVMRRGDLGFSRERAAVD